jgi:hypothetical protein
LIFVCFEERPSLRREGVAEGTRFAFFNNRFFKTIHRACPKAEKINGLQLLFFCHFKNIARTNASNSSI